MKSIATIFSLIMMLVACQSANPPLSEQELADNNRGVGLMGQYRNEDARQVFAELLAARPDWVDVEVNLAIATLNRQQENDELLALEIVERVLERHPHHLRARYIAGLMRFYIGQPEPALAHFQTLREAVPEDAHLAYFTAQTLAQLDQPEAALAMYRHAIQQDPYLRSSYYGAALILRQLGDAEGAREQLALYQRFANNPRAQLAEFRYTRKGPLAEALAVSADVDRKPMPPPQGPLFAEPIRLGEVAVQGSALTLTTADVSGDGRQDLFITGGAGQVNQLWQNTATGFRAVPHPLNAIEGVNAVAWADIHNEGDLAVYLCRSEGHSLRSRASGWAPMVSSDLDVPDYCHDVAVFDADHDGDLDIFVAGSQGNELLNNNLNGQFRRLSVEAEPLLAGLGMPSRQVLPVDLDGDRITDVVVINEQAPHQVLHNDRLWQYRPAEGFDAFVAASLVAVVAMDPWATGQTTLITADQTGQIQHWQADHAGQWQPDHLMQVPAPVHSLVAMDFDGNGRPDLLVHHAEGFAVWGWQDSAVQWSAKFVSDQRLLAMTPILIDPAAGPALATIVQDADALLPELWLWPAGKGRYGFVSVQPTGMTDVGEGMRSNASGLGTRLVARVDQRWSIVDYLDAHSAPGQSLQPVALGLGGGQRIDFLKLFWSDGVLQTELSLLPGPVHRISELQRQLASCPVLFAWNGERFDFVSDLLGVGGIGFFQSPGVYAEPRPWEFFLFPEGSIAARDDGRYAIKIGEPMEEIAYLDTASLHVFDLPPGWGVTLNERMNTGSGPAPDGAPVFYRLGSLRTPVRASNHRGEDVTEAIVHQDHVAADPGPRDRRFLGRLAEDHVLTLEFDAVINPPGSNPVLLAYGWVEYPYSQTVFAAWQAGADYRPPSLSAYAEGRWQMVHAQFGYPAGMPREMSMSLDAMPPGTTALRLSGNWEVYWDYLAVIDAEAPPATIRQYHQGIEVARLAKTGFARRDTLAQQLPYYDYEDRSPFWDTKYPLGYYTALGPVEPLVAQANNAFALIGPGEELHLEFAAPPALEDPRWQRRVVLEVRGFAKDMDLYTQDGSTVGPLPYTEGVDSSQRSALHQRYLNRFQGGF